MAVSWDRDQRAIARAERLPLICLAVDSSETGWSGGKIVFAGPVPSHVAAAVLDYMRKLIEDLQKEEACGPGAS